MRRSLRHEVIAEEDMAGVGTRLHHEATAGDTQAKVDLLGLTWGEEAVQRLWSVRRTRIQAVSVLAFPRLHKTAADNEQGK